MTKKRFVYISMAIVLALLIIVLPGCQQKECVQIQGLSHTTGPLDLTASASASGPALYFEGDSDTGLYSAAANQLGLSTGGTERLNLSSSGLGFSGGFAATLGAAEKVLIDGDSTAHTGTDGVLDVDAATITADVSAVNVAMTTNDGATAAEDAFGLVMTLTQDDADGDLFGISISAAATANAAAGSYEAGIVYDCAENTAGACLDGVRLTAGTATGMTDGFDASDADIVNAVNIGVNPILGSNADTLFLGLTDHHLTLTGDEAAAVTFIGADNSSPADTVFDTTGAGSITVGSVDVLAVTVQTDDTGDGSDLVLPAQGVNAGEILNDTITFAQISDSSAVDADTDFTMADGIELSLTPSHTTGDTEGLLIDIDQVDDGAATDDVYAFKVDATSESGDAGDTFRGIGIVWEEGTANTIMDAAIAIDNEETTAATMTDAIIVTSSGVDTGVTDAIDVSATNILNAINLGDNDVVVSTNLGLKNSTSGNVVMNFHDYADSGDDDMAHAAITVNCTTATSGNEDCDFTVGVAEAGAAADTRFMIDADGGVDIGSANSSDVVLTAGTAVATMTEPAAAGSGGDIWDIIATFAAMDGSDVSLGIDLNLTGADASGTGNVLAALDIDLTTADAQVQETAILLNDADFDVAIEAGDVPAIFTAQTLFWDFLGDTVPAEVVEASGTDNEAVQAMASEQYGAYQLTSGDTNANCAGDCELVGGGLMWQADQGSLVFQARLHIDDITNAIVCVGLSDSVGVEMPGTIGVGTDTPAYVADDFLAFCYDSGSTTANWFALGRDNTVAGTGIGVVVGTGPANGVYQVLRIEVDAGGEDARFYLNGTEVATCTANCITITDLLSPIVVVDTNTTASVVVDIDYIYASAQRE